MPGRGSRMWALAGLLGGLALLALLVAKVVNGWGSISAQIDGVDAAAIAVALAAMVVGEIIVAGVWTWNLRRFSTTTRPFLGISIGLVANLARLIPGAVFSYATRVALAPRAASTRRAALAATGIETIASAAAAVLLGGTVLLDPVLAASIPGGRWWLLGIPLALAAAYFPAWLPMVNRLLVKRDRDPIPAIAPRRAVMSLALYAGVWLVFGTSIGAVADALGLTAPGVLVTGGMFAVSWLIGFVILFVPGGLGVREGVLAALLTPALGLDAAILVSLITRLVWWLADALLAVVGALVLIRHRPQTSRR